MRSRDRCENWKTLQNVNDPKAASGRLLFLLDGLDEITGVASLSRCALNITIELMSPPHHQLEPKVQQRGHPHSPRADSGEMKDNSNHVNYFHDDCDHQAILAGRLAPGAHVIVTSRPHTLTYLQVPNCQFGALFPRFWVLGLQKLSNETALFV